MLFEESVKNFLQHNPAEGYDKDVENFKKYIFSIGVKNKASLTYLQGIRTEEIIRSLEYYIENSGISSIDTALRYVSCIKEYLSYLLHQEIIVNIELTKEFGLPTYSDKSFRYKVNKYISENNDLKERKDFIAFNENEIKLLIKDCDDTINDELVQKRAISSKKYFNKIRASVIIKLIIFSGLRYEHLYTLRRNCLDLVHNTIEINDFILHLPHNLRDQLETYESILLSIDSKNENRKYLFVNFGGAMISKQTSTVSGYLKTLTGRMDLNGIIKYTVIKMIYKGINESIIKKLTGIESTIFDPCQTVVNNNLKQSANSYLDAKVRSLDIFDIL